MSDFDIDVLSEDLNVFDRKQPVAVIRTKKSNHVESSDFLMHYGITGMKWGIRRFQNADGSLTDAGKKRYGSTSDEVKKKLDEAREKETASRRKLDDINGASVFNFIKRNDLTVRSAEKKLHKAVKKATELEKIYEKMPKDDATNKSTEKYKADSQILKDLKSFEKMDANEKEEIGEKVMNSMRDYLKTRDTADYDPDNEKHFKDMEVWLSTQMDEKSGTVATGYRTQANKKAREELAKNAEECNRRMNEVKEEIGFNVKSAMSDKGWWKNFIAENKRLSEALKNDPEWTELNKETKRLQGNVTGVILKDIGLKDTPENRKLIWPFFIQSWDDVYD